MRTKQEKYFAIGLVFAIGSLYATSVYNYFLEPELVPAAYASVPSQSEADQQASRILEVIRVEDADSQLFRPIGKQGVYVPGTMCTLTNSNLSPDGTFYNVPQSCFFLNKKEK